MKLVRSYTAATGLLRAAVAALVCSSLACGSRSSLAGGYSEPTDPPPPPGPSGIAGAHTMPPTAGQPSMPPVNPGMPTEPPPPSCESISLTIDDLRPTVTLLVDQSGSMRQGYPTQDSGQSRWTIVRQALLDENTGVVRKLEHSMQFSLAFYTSHNGTSGGTCPILSEVRAATGNYEAIRTLYDSVSPDDDTPTGAAIAQIVKEIRQAKRQGPEVLLLVTDGDPDTCEVPDPQTEAGQLEALSAASTAYASGIAFYVLGISDDVSQNNLQQLANAGEGKPVSAVFGVDPDAAQPFQASSDLAGLTAQLNGILARVPLCEITLDRKVSDAEVGSAHVVLDGQPLSLGQADGWKLSDPKHLSITGKACEELRAKGKRLTVRISCD